MGLSSCDTALTLLGSAEVGTGTRKPKTFRGVGIGTPRSALADPCLRLLAGVQTSVASQGPLRRGFFCVCVLGNRALLGAFSFGVGAQQCQFSPVLVVAAYALIALLFVADATLEPSSSPAIVTSQRLGLPERQRPDGIQTLIARPAPAPDMASQAVLAAQPKSPPDATAHIGSAALAARAKAPHKDKRITGHQQTRFFDRFSIKGY
jgi:hypothetical protein